MGGLVTNYEDSRLAISKKTVVRATFGRHSVKTE